METNNLGNLPPQLIPKPAVSKKWYRHKGIVSIGILIILAVLVSWVYFAKQPGSPGNQNVNQNSFLGGIVDNSSPNDPLVGKVISFKAPLLYWQDCTGCGGSPKELEINRTLACPDNSIVLGAYLFKDKFANVTYVPTTMTFTVTEVFKPHNYGVNSIDAGPGDYRVAVLKDTNGLSSTVLAQILI